MKKLISALECAATIGVGRDKMYSLIKSDPDLPIIKIGNITKINKDLLDKYLEKKCDKGNM